MISDLKNKNKKHIARGEDGGEDGDGDGNGDGDGGVSNIGDTGDAGSAEREKGNAEISTYDTAVASSSSSAAAAAAAASSSSAVAAAASRDYTDITIDNWIFLPHKSESTNGPFFYNTDTQVGQFGFPPVSIL